MRWAFHIGYQKCASTWLQWNVFPRLPEVNFIGKCGKYMGQPNGKSLGINHELYGEIAGQITAPPDLYDPDRLLGAGDSADKGDASGTVTLLSAEGLVGNPWRYANEGETYVTRIREAFRDVHIIVIVRDQIAILESLYKQYLLEGGCEKPEVLFAGPCAQVDFRLAFLDYHALAHHCVKTFGADRVCVLPFELIRSDGHQAFCDRICRFLDTPRIALDDEDIASVRQGYDANLTYFTRCANRLLRSDFNPEGHFDRRSLPGRIVWRGARHAAALDRRRGTARPVLGGMDTDLLRARFRDGNRILQNLVDVDLGSLGFSV